MNLLFCCVFVLANLNNVAAVLYLLLADLTSENYRLVCWAALLTQPGVYYVVYLCAAWAALKEILLVSSPDVLLTETLSLAGLMPVYILLGILKLLHTRVSSVYVSPQRQAQSRREWLKESAVLPIATQGFLQCIPGLSIAFLNGINVYSPLHMLFAWSSVGMATLAGLAVCGTLSPRRQQAV